MTTPQEAVWSQWLSERSQDEQHALMSAMVQGGWRPEFPPEDAEPTAKLLRPPVEDFISATSPPYVDVHQLNDFFNVVAYHYNILLKGPKGCGKSLAVDNFACATKTPKITMNCSEDSKEKHILGNFIIKQGLKGIESPWVLGAVAKAIDIANEYGRAILVFEEVNALTPQIQKQLNSLLDFRRSVDIGQLSRSFKLRENAFLWVVGTMNPCFHPDTDVLTPRGVKKVVDLKVGDSIYSFNKETGKSELDTVAKVWATPCDGELIVVENQHVKLRITPQHKMVVKGRAAKSWDLKTAGELAEWMEDKGPTNSDKLYPKPYNLPDGEDMPMFSLKGEGYEEWMPKTNTKNTTKTLYQTDDFLRLLGWYISEGSTYFTAKGEYRVHIAQQKQPNLSRIENLLERMEINFFPAMKGAEQSGVVFNNKLLFHALQHYGGVRSENKKIDNSLFKLSRKHLNCLFETMYLGDGDTQTERVNQAWALERGTKVFRSMRYSTKSHQLYLDVLWLGTYLGYITSRHHDTEGMYRIGMRKGRPHTTHLEYETIQYDGMVIDVEVTKNRTLCAGEDGKFLFVSNSVYGGTYELNEDLRSRWIDVDLGYPNRAQERAIIDANVTFTPRPAPDPNKQLAEWNSMVDTFIKLGGETRTGNTQYALSSRDLVTHVRLVKDLGLEQALQLLVCKFEGDDKKTILSRISTNFKGIHPKETWSA